MAIEPVIRCSEINRSLKFFTEILDFTVVTPPDPDPEEFMSKYALLERNGDLVHLSSHAGDGQYGNLIYVRVENLDQLFSSFVSNGLNTKDLGETSALRGGPVDQTWGMREFWVNDPDRNVVRFGQSI